MICASVSAGTEVLKRLYRVSRCRVSAEVQCCSAEVQRRGAGEEVKRCRSSIEVWRCGGSEMQKCRRGADVYRHRGLEVVQVQERCRGAEVYW